MAKKDHGGGYPMSGKISDRIRSGEIAASKVHRDAEEASVEAVRGGSGHSLGDGATSRGGRAGAS